MEINDVNWAIISNHSVLPYEGMGVFGETYCVLLAQYLRDYFEPIANFGE